MNRKRLLLAALAGLLVLSLGYAFWAMPRQEKAPPRPERAPATARKLAAGKTAAPPSERLHLGLLAQEPQPFTDAARDIFRFRGGGAPVVETTEATTAAAAGPEPPPPPPPPPPTPEEILQEKVAGFTFRGFLDKGGVRTVFLSGGGEMVLVKTGESFGKNRDLVAREITAGEMVVGSAEGPETVRIKLAENEALVPTLMSSGTALPTTRPAAAPGGSLPPRRSILQQRAPVRALPLQEEGVEQNEQEPTKNVSQEELLKQDPNGDGNGNN